MNQRIQELIEQAEKYAEEKSTWQDDYHGYGDFEDIFKEKFAELLIHDVLSQNILQAQRVDKDPVCQNYPKEVIATFFYEDMLKRYGVE